MSKISLASNANGTGIFTLASPATNTNRTLTLPDSTGTLLDTNGGTITGTLTVTGVTTLGNGAILGSPSTVGTMPAFTLGGTVSGGGNNINNVVIGASSPLAGSFTTVTASGAITATGAITQSTFGQLTNDGASDFRVDSTSGKTLSLRSIATDLVISADPGVAGTKTVTIKTSGVTPAVFSTTGLAVTGTLSATATGAYFTNNGVTTSAKYIQILNTNGGAYFGVESSAGGAMITGSTGYDAAIAGQSGIAFSGSNGNAMQMRLTSTGLAVTGSLNVTKSGGGLATFSQTSATGYGISIVPGADTVYDAFTINNAANTVNKIRMFGDGSASFAGTLSGGTSGTGYSFSGSAPATSLTLDASGQLGVGTATPAYKVTVQSVGTSTAPQLKLQNPVDSNSSQGAANNLSAGQLLFGSTGANLLSAKIESLYNADASFGRSANLIFSNADGTGSLSARMTIDVAGNLGLGVTPSAWAGAGRFAVQVGGSVVSSFAGNVNTSVANNYYFNGSVDSFINGSGYASYYTQTSNGAHIWATSTAASSSANSQATLTQAMTLDASGNLGVGTTTPLTKVEARGTPDSNWGNAALFDNRTVAIDQGGVLAFGGYKTTTTSQSAFAQIAGRKENATAGNEAGYLAFITNNNTTYVERARIDSSGNLLVGTTNVATSASPSAGVSGGNFRSIRNITTIPGLTTATVLTLSSSVSGVYIVQANFGPQSNEIYGGMLIVVANNGSFRIVTNGGGASSVLTLSGANVQMANAVGSTLDAYASAVLIAN